MPTTITTLPDAPSRAEPTTFSDKADAFLGALDEFVTELNTVISELNVLATAMDLNDVTDTSTTSLAVGIGAKTFTVTAGKSFRVGMSLKCAYSSTVWMHGDVTSYSGTSLVVNVTTICGSGTQASWNISLSGPTGTAYHLLSAKTADATLSATELGGNYTFTNTGAGGAVNLTLPAGVAGYKATFIVTVAQYFKVTAAGAEKVRYYDTQGAAGGYVRSNIIGTRWTLTWTGNDWSIGDLVGVLNYDE